MNCSLWALRESAWSWSRSIPKSREISGHSAARRWRQERLGCWWWGKEQIYGTRKRFGLRVEEAVGVAQAAGFVAVGAVVSGGQRVGALGRHRRDRALYLGGEAHGLSDSVSETLDELVSIPMREGVDSYAVNPAAAILLHGLGPFGDRS